MRGLTELRTTMTCTGICQVPKVERGQNHNKESLGGRVGRLNNDGKKKSHQKRDKTLLKRPRSVLENIYPPNKFTFETKKPKTDEKRKDKERRGVSILRSFKIPYSLP